MGKFIYEDKKAWKEQLVKNYKSCAEANKLNWTDEEINRKADEKINDPKVVERYKRAAALREKVDKGNEMMSEIKTEFLKTHTEAEWNGLNGYGPFAYCKLDYSGTPEARQKNYEYIEKLTDRSFAKKEIMKDFNRLIDADPKKFAFSSPEEGFQIYEDNFELVTVAFSVARMFGTVGGYEMSPEFKAFYDEHKRAIEDLSACMSMETIYSKPSRLVIPEVSFELATSAMMSYSMNNASLVGQFEGFSFQKGNPMMEATTMIATSEQLKEQTEIITQYDKAKILKDFPKDLLRNYKCELEGNPINIGDGINKLVQNNAKVTFIPLTEEEKAANKFAIGHPVADDVATIDAGRELREIAKAMQETDHWYNWNNSKEFSNLLKALKEVPEKDSSFNSVEKVKTEFTKIQGLAKAYFDKKNGSTLNANGQKRFDLCSRLVNLCDKTMEDDFFHKIIPNMDPQQARHQVDLTNEIDGPKEMENMIDPIDKTRNLEKNIEVDTEVSL